MNAATAPAVPARFDWRYWFCIWVEMLERLAFCTTYPVVAIYIMQADDPGGLHLTAGDKGTILGVWAMVQSLLPTVTGGLADRYGYRLSIAAALIFNALGYTLMALFHSYTGFFAGILVLAFGTAFFKPALQGTLAHTLSKETASVGWGFFYFIVNVGSFAGHAITPLMLGKVAADRTFSNWQWVYGSCAVFSLINLASLVRFPVIESGARKDEPFWQVFVRTLVNVVEPRLLAWLLIMSGFWMMMYQLWDMAPNFIADWVHSGEVARYVPFESWVETGPDGHQRVPQQVLLSLNSTLIVVCVVVVSRLVSRMRTLSAMLLGMIASTGGVLVAGLTQSGWVLLGGIALFSLGEMLVGPKKSEYLGLIAPPGKKGLYLGYVNIPTGIGRGLGNLLAGWLYGQHGEKANLALRYMVERQLVPTSMPWQGDADNLSKITGIERTEAFARLQSLLDMDGQEVTRLLWDTYHPHLSVWLPFAAVGVVSAIALAIFGRMARRWSDMNA